MVEPPPGPWHTNQTVSATFQSACPRNSLGRRGSFLTVERKADGVGGGWEIVSTASLQPLHLPVSSRKHMCPSTPALKGNAAGFTAITTSPHGTSRAGHVLDSAYALICAYQG